MFGGSGVALETSELQKQCAAAEARILAARREFDRRRKPLEEVARAKREALERRKVWALGIVGRGGKGRWRYTRGWYRGKPYLPRFFVC